MANQTWQQPPVVIVLMQVVFQPIFNFVTVIQQLQPMLKDLGWIGSNVFDQQIIESIFENNGQVSSNNRSERVYQFCTADLKEVVDIRETAITLSVANYEDFKVTYKRFQECLEKLQGLIQDSIVQRMGLRYVDLFQATEDLPLTEQLKSLAREIIPSEISSQQIIQLKPSTDCVLLLRVSQGELLRQVLQEFLPQPQANILIVIQKRILDVLNSPEPFSAEQYLVMDLDASKLFQLGTPSLQLSEITKIDSAFYDLHQHCKTIFDEQISDRAIGFYKFGHKVGNV